MNTTFDNDTLTAYVFGELPADEAAAIARAAAADPSLAAKLDYLAAFVTDVPTAPVQMPLRPTYLWTRRRFVQRLAACAAGVAAVGGAGFAGYELLKPRPLLDDDFDDDWLDTNKWDVSLGRRGVREQHGYVRVMNRGSIVTRREFPEPIEVSFDWMWIDWADDPYYAEDFKVALRTSGRFHNERPYEIKDGVIVRLTIIGAHVSISLREGEPVPNDKFPLRQLVRAPEGAVPMSGGKWHHVRITDDGRMVSVYLTGPKIDKKYETTPVVTAECNEKFAERRIALYNRELVGEATHESRIDNFKVSRLADR